MKKIVFSIVFVFCFFSLFAQSSKKEIPKDLKPWISWATWDVKNIGSPSPYNNAKVSYSFWPSQLNLVLGKRGNNFSLNVEVFSETFVSLPGDGKNWPFNVKANGRSIPVTLQKGSPSIKLDKGKYSIKGNFNFNQLPQTLKIPRFVGILNLILNGGKVDFPDINNNGVLRLKSSKVKVQDKDYISAKVYYLLKDGIPLNLDIQVDLTVSGKAREKNLNLTVPDGFLVSSVGSALPAKVDKDNNLIVQVRSGKWSVVVNTFRTDNVKEVKFNKNKKLIAEKSFIAFQGNTKLRVLDVKAGDSVDSSQTTIPYAWKKFPVYYWNMKEPVKLVEELRGSLKTDNVTLALYRSLWLSESGDKYKFKDEVKGNIYEVGRLDKVGIDKLGSVKVNKKDMLITENPVNKLNGVELRDLNIEVEAVGEIEKKSSIPVSGWSKDVNNVDLTFNLPAGYRMFAIFGADKSYGDWLSSWNLLDIFLLLIFSIAMFRLWGLKAGIITFIGFALMYHEPNSPKYVWFFLLIPVAILKVVKEGTFYKILNYWKYLALISLVLISIPFITKQAQLVLYPQLEKPYSNLNYYKENIYSKRQVVPISKKIKSKIKEELVMTAEAPMGDIVSYSQQRNLQYKPFAKVQTGPAIPKWNWNSVRCSFRRNVTGSENLTPILITPFFFKLMGIGRILFILLIAMFMLQIPLSLKKVKKVASVALFLLFFFNSNAEIPDNNTLKLLKNRVLELPDCFPNCASIEDLKIKVYKDTISYDLKVHTETLTAIPLPGQYSSLVPIKCSVNGQSAPLRKEGNYLWVALNKGLNNLKVSSKIFKKNNFEVSFYLKPKKVSVNASGWTFSGVSNNGVPDNQLFFNKIVKSKSVEKDKFSVDSYNPIIVVERTLELGQTWQVYTNVIRKTSAANPLALKIPLLASEKVLTSNIKIENDKFVLVKLSAGQNRVSYKSELPVMNTIKLTSENSENMVEQWGIIYSEMWNVESKELKPIYFNSGNKLKPEWRPWPGENVTLSVTKPMAVKGKNVTISKVDYKSVAGLKVTKYNLDLIIKSSIGKAFPVDLPKESKIKFVKKNNKNISVKVKDNTLSIPLNPGTQNISIEFTKNNGISFFTKMEKVTLPDLASNIYLNMKVPGSRWLLLTGGPVMGPAVRFWGLFIVVLLVAFILGGLKQSPLSKSEWILLSIGLTQIPIYFALFVVLWLFWLKKRGETNLEKVDSYLFNFQQICAAGLTFVVLLIFISIVYQGLLGRPEMYVVGNNSSVFSLSWFKDEVSATLPKAYFISFSIWVYRIFMLLWALWLANSLIKWLKWGFEQFSKNGIWKNRVKKQKIETVTK